MHPAPCISVRPMGTLAEAARNKSVSRDNPRQLGKERARLVGSFPWKSMMQIVDPEGRIHQFLWRRSRAVSYAK